jgi:hypothetical protein
MELSHVALCKIVKGGDLYKALKAAQPDTQFTPAHQIMVTFETPVLTVSDGPYHREMAKAHRIRLYTLAEKGKRALQNVDGLTIDSYYQALASACVSGPAKAIAAMLELPEICRAESMQNVVIVPAAQHTK